MGAFKINLIRDLVRLWDIPILVFDFKPITALWQKLCGKVYWCDARSVSSNRGFSNFLATAFHMEKVVLFLV
jgi:hypothetical protein